MDTSQLMVIIWGALGTVVTGLATWLTTLLVSWLNTKIKDQKLKTFLTKFTEVLSNCVNSLTQTTVNELKKSGEFDNEAAKYVKEECVKLIKSQLSVDMVQFIQENFGDLTDYISVQIESLLLQTKNLY